MSRRTEAKLGQKWCNGNSWHKHVRTGRIDRRRGRMEARDEHQDAPVSRLEPRTRAQGD